MSLSFKALAAQSYTLYYSTTIRVICNCQALAYKCLSSHSKWLTRFNPDGINSKLKGMEDFKKTDIDQYFINMANLIWSAWHLQDDDKQDIMAAVETDKHVYMF